MNKPQRCGLLELKGAFMKHLQHMESNMLLSETAFAALQHDERVNPDTMWTTDPDKAAIMKEEEAPPLGDVFRLIDIL